MGNKINEESLIERKETIDGFLKEIQSMTDHRSKQGRSYTLGEIFLLILCAQICGFESLREYELYGKMKLDLLKKCLPYSRGVPSKSTLARILSVFEPSYLESLLMKWMQAIVQAHEKQKQIAIDGKTHRGFHSQGEEKLHLVHAYGIESGLVLGQEKVAMKSNEITAIPVLLEAMHIEGQIISIDAMGCQKSIAEKVIEKKADYVLALKGNHSQLHEDIALYFEEKKHLTTCEQYEDLDKGHGRFEIRRCYVTDQIHWLDRRQEWKGLKSIVAVESICVIKGKETRETRYFISSLHADPKL